MAQKTPFKFLPTTGESALAGLHIVDAHKFRMVCTAEWKFNPWTGDRRAGADVETDPWGKLIIPPGEEIVAAKATDVVNHPAHYTAGGVECIDAIAAATTGLEGIEAACTANAIKYLWRWKRKNGQEDLRKARWYINHLLGEN